ncbi:hypothetical protein [Burkholderia sp. F1]|uniref:hypothetical protein n=1 Tax=Burkholderia sp. F1 TaxID=3366817 RepID=UPI003D74E9F4
MSAKVSRASKWIGVGWKWLKALLMIWGACAIAFHVVQFLVGRAGDKDSGYFPLKEIPSRDGKYAIDIGFSSGGGGISPYCHDYVLVKELGVAGRAGQRDLVYSAPCLGNGALTAEWEGERVIVKAHGGSGYADLRYKNRTDFGVSVSFEIQ